MTEVDRSLIGTSAPPFLVEVERGAIRKFADAIGDDNLLYRDDAFARRHGYEGIVAPPTFPTCFRAPQDPPWIAALDRRRIVAGEMGFHYHRPIVAGMRFECRLQLVGIDDKDGARGAMSLLRQVMSGYRVDNDGVAHECVFAVRRTTVYRSAQQVASRSLA
ncbi:FAS1-like dehydratase domain-containing protein [Paraburkholderia susongensis]|uniref:N-terminal half of MaoC dehydratase n=1 Tax=Paraburkholderia susongensis TaxID=1515439 RepID=A0A1X7I1X2_9BURK|nr:MaoC family dehydratase N-terminal domain-containing protein [Paraburkholderia susongensis]SMG08318.1 N-terminal half of MaoC dehydratase [Paraburkholderia susongensis]